MTMPTRIHFGIAALAVVVTLGVVVPLSARQRAEVAVGWDAAGVASLRVNGVERLYHNAAEPYYGTLEVQGVRLRRWDGSEVVAERKALGTVVRADERSVTRTFAWGTVRGTFVPVGDRLEIAITVTNSSPYVLESGRWQLFTLRFPKTPKGYSGAGRWTHNVGQPGVLEADFGEGVLAATIEDLGRPLQIGLPNSIDPPTHRAYPLQITTEERGIPSGFPGPAVQRPIYPGGSDTYHVTLRFGAAGTPVERLAAPTVAAFAAAYPFHLEWKDRRPIGSLHLSTSEAPYHSPGNPRGWFADPKGVDITTEAGRARFRERLMKYADDSIKILKGMDAQGMIVWDTEGQEYPHATSYLGDPRSLPAEMDAVADEFFKKYRDAGLRVGMTLRPQAPVRPAYGADVRQAGVADVAHLLDEKIRYAQKRWGCTLFYVDSNVWFDERRPPNDGDAYRLMAASIFQEVASAHPDVLLFPEHQDTRYYAYTAPYDELRGGVASTPPLVRAAYPNAFTLIYVPDAPVDERRAELVEAVRRGDILLFRAWFDDPFNAKVRNIYEEARKPRQ